MKYYCREIIKSTCILKDFSFSTAVSYLLSPCPNLPPSPDPHEYTSPSRLRAMKCLHSGFVAILTISHFPASDSINTGPYSWYKNKTTHYILEIGTRQLANASVKTVGWVSNHWSFSCLASKMLFLQNCLTHWHPELFAKKAFLGILVLFRLDLGQISPNVPKNALASQPWLRFLATSIVFYDILTRACAEIKILR